jgi:hypothetical protein
MGNTQQGQIVKLTENPGFQEAFGGIYSGGTGSMLCSQYGTQTDPSIVNRRKVRVIKEDQTDWRRNRPRIVISAGQSAGSPDYLVQVVAYSIPIRYETPPRSMIPLSLPNEKCK